MEVELIDLDRTLKWSLGRTAVVQGERHQRRLAIRREDTRHVSKLFFQFQFQVNCNFTELLQGIDNFNSNFVQSALTDIVKDRQLL